MFVYWITYSRFVWIEKSGNADTVIDVFNIRLRGFTKFELGIFFLPSLCIILLKTSTFLEEDQKEPREPENINENPKRAAYEINPLTLFMNYGVYICRYNSNQIYFENRSWGKPQSKSQRSHQVAYLGK